MPKFARLREQSEYFMDRVYRVIAFFAWHGNTMQYWRRCELKAFFSPGTHGNSPAGYRCTTHNVEVHTA